MNGEIRVRTEPTPTTHQQDPIGTLVKAQAKASTPLLALSFLGLLVSFVAPFALASIIDRVIVFGLPASLFSIVGILLIAAVFEALINRLKGLFAAFSSAKLTAQIAERVVASALRQPTTKLLGSKGRATVSTLAEFNFFRDTLSQLLLYAIQLVFSVGIYMIVLLFLNPWMTLAVLLTVPLHALIYWVLARQSKAKIRESVTTNSDFTASIQTAVTAIETIHAYGLEQKQSQTSAALITQALEQGFVARAATNTAQSVSKFLSRLTEAAIICLGALAVMSKELSLGELIVFQMLLSRMTQPISQAGVNWDKLYRLRTIVGEWQGLIDQRVVRRRGSADATEVRGQSIVQFDRLSFSYPGSPKPTLRDISFELGGGETLFLLGQSGSGKSTMVRLLTGIVTPTEGALTIKGISPDCVEESRRRQLVAAAFQEPILLPGTIGENISSFSEPVSDADIHEAAKLAGAADFIEALPDGYDTLVGTTGYAVSGGERQRICLARMLACKAAVMIIDEGTSGLQRSLEVTVIQRIQESMTKDQVLLVITHREDLMNMGTRAIRLEAGAVINDHLIM
jgi:ABC-type bacteriocin/lantibiotic exporter with double-glycine peptidase domain